MRYNVQRGKLTIHQNRGSPMIAHSYLHLMSKLGVTASHSRPRVSNDNPFSESQFKTIKYQPDYPGKFKGIEHARQWCENYFESYNFSHHHSSLAGFTPSQVFKGQCTTPSSARQTTLDGHLKTHPERFVKGRPRINMPPGSVFINPVQPNEQGEDTNTAVNFPTLQAARDSKLNIH